MASKSQIEYLELLAQDGCKGARQRLEFIRQNQRPLFNSGSVSLPNPTSLEDARAFEYYSAHSELMRTEQ